MVSQAGNNTGGSNLDLQIQAHPNGREFLVMGKSTYQYRGQIKAIGSTWNRSFKAWSFDNSKRAEVDALINNLRQGLVPTAPQNVVDTRFQRLYYKPVPCPVSGMRVKIMIKREGGNQEVWATVNLTQNTGKNVDTAFMTPDGGVPDPSGGQYLRAVIINGRWQLLGMTHDHDIHFELGPAPGSST